MGKQHSNEDYQRLKMLSYQVRATTALKGTVKNNFLLDCIDRNCREGELLRDIVKLHYQLIEQYDIKGSPAFKEILNRI